VYIYLLYNSQTIGTGHGLEERSSILGTCVRKLLSVIAVFRPVLATRPAVESTTRGFLFGRKGGIKGTRP
jgi:hypothetical protein